VPGRHRVALVLSVLGALLLLFPLGWALFGSLEPEAVLFGRATLIPREFTLEHYRALFAERDFWLPIRNSLVVSSLTTVLCVFLGSPCAYALARLHFAGKRVVSMALLMVGMFPQISIVSPLYLVLRRAGLINTYPGLIVPYLTFAMPLAVWLLVGHFRRIPPNIEEAALMDGAGRLGTLWKIVLPLALPGVVTTAILTFVYCWNEFLFALSFTLGPDCQTVPVAIALLRGRYQVSWGQILAGSVLATTPIALLVLAFQRRIVRTFAGWA
jgi:ABC-type glycerol-3-phosphate transport system permease component